MKLNPNFLTHETKGEHFIISTSQTTFKGIVKNNDTAAFIVECLKAETTPDEIADKVMAEYEDAVRPVVEKDVADILDKLRSIGALEE